jgi:ABC-type antimicrobial peptide transport system permease subunit
MARPLLHWRYLSHEASYRWKRTLLTVAGIAMAVTLVLLLDVLGRAFSDVSTLPFKSLSADLLVQRSATKDAVPNQMGVILPYSAQPISAAEMTRLAGEDGVEAAGGFVLLWNLGDGRFYSISGLDLTDGQPLLGPAKVRDWMLKGRMPNPASHEVLVERHYGAFYRIKPGNTITLSGQKFTVSGVVDIQGGGQFVASNFYMDINEARVLGGLSGKAVNQVFLKVANIDQTETIKNRIAGWLTKASIVSSGSMLQLFGGISQVIGRFHLFALIGGGVAAAALISTLLLGAMAERNKEAAILQTLGWSRGQTRRQLIGEAALQGLIGGLFSLVLLSIALVLLGQVHLQLPSNLAGENPVEFAAGGFQPPPESVALPVGALLWDWLTPPLVTGVFCALIGWMLSARSTAGSLWAAVKS